MTCLARSRLTKAGRTVPWLECLEHRHVLSAVSLPPGITAVQFEPSAGTGQELVISFDQSTVDAITNEFSVPFAMLINDFDVNSDFQLDGPAGTVFGFGDPPAVENVVQDGNATEVIIPLANPLLAGTYQVSLNWGTNLDVAFSLLDMSAANTFWTSLAATPTPATIAELTVQPQNGAKLAQATDLGVIGPNADSVVGTLNPASVPAPVDLYKITLAPGEVWELGVSISTQNSDSSLLTGLTLFGPSGNVLAESAAGQGLLDDPDDPFLFAGLTPTPGADTYYIGVSGYGNMPYGDLGYDPLKGIPGTLGIMQPAGAFELSVIAQPHDQPTQLAGFSLSHEDPLNPSPTSMTLNFSAPVDVTELFTPDEQETALQVVDSSGRIWPVTAVSYQTTDAQLTLTFDEPLPAGQYALTVASSGGLTDLAGEPVVAVGEPAGVLATWTVRERSGPSSPNDLGVLWPSTADVVWPSAQGSLSETTTLATGQEETYRWVVIVPGLYKLQTEVDGSSVEVVNASGSKANVLDLGSSNRSNNYLMVLSAGVYEVTFTNVGTQRAVIQWLLKIESLDWEKIINNGISQSSALSLMTFAPSTPSVVNGAETGLLSIPPSAVGSAFDSSLGSVPSNLLVTSNTVLAGQPSWDEQAVGLPAEMSGLGLSGGGGQSLLPGSRSLFASSQDTDDDALAMIQSPTKNLAGKDLPTGPTFGAALTQPDAEPTSARADVRALARTEWVMRIGSLVQDWLTASRPGDAHQLATAQSVPPTDITSHQSARFVKASTSPWRDRHLVFAVRSELGATASLFMIGAVAYRLRQPIRSWWRAKVQIAGPARAHSGRALPGPHPVARLSRMNTHVLKRY